MKWVRFSIFHYREKENALTHSWDGRYKDFVDSIGYSKKIIIEKCFLGHKRKQQ